MPQLLSISGVIEKNRVASDVPYLMLIEIDVINPLSGAIDQTLYLTNNTEDWTFNAQLYTAAPFTVDITEEAGTQATVTLSIEDITGTVRETVASYFGGIGFPVRIMAVRADPTLTVPEVKEYFAVVSTSMPSYTINMTLGAENALVIAFPPRTQRRNVCSWVFKSAACGYQNQAGLSDTVNNSCDRSYKGTNGCGAHNNTINFGGFPGIQLS